MAGLSGLFPAVLAGLAQASPDDRTGWVQAPVALMILAVPILCLALFALSLPRSVPEVRKGRLQLTVGLLPLAALGLYAFYESGISAETNIRVDLLLIYPALVLAFVSWPALIVAYLIGRR